MAQTQTQTPIRTRAEIEADISAARERLAANVVGLINQVHPKAVVHRRVTDARASATRWYEQAKAQVIDPQGKVSTERVALIGAAAAGLMTFMLLVRSIVRGIAPR